MQVNTNMCKENNQAAQRVLNVNNGKTFTYPKNIYLIALLLHTFPTKVANLLKNLVYYANKNPISIKEF